MGDLIEGQIQTAEQAARVQVIADEYASAAMSATDLAERDRFWALADRNIEAIEDYKRRQAAEEES